MGVDNEKKYGISFIIKKKIITKTESRNTGKEYPMIGTLRVYTFCEKKNSIQTVSKR